LSEVSEDQNPNADRPRFSILQLLGAVTFAALLLGVLVTGYQARVKIAKLQQARAVAEMKADELRIAHANEKGQGLRTKYAEKMFFHVSSNPERYPELRAALKNYDQQKIGISLHRLAEDDNLAHVCFYSMNVDPSLPVFSQPFLIQEEPFEVLDTVVGQQSRVPRLQEGQWIFGCGENDGDRWFSIEDRKFRAR